MEAKFTDIEGYGVRYWEGGSGFPLLMVHGVGPGTSVVGNFGPAMEALAERIRREGKGRDFDCIIGMSGGIDSSYLTYLAATEMGLRPLIFHDSLLGCCSHVACSRLLHKWCHHLL